MEVDHARQDMRAPRRASPPMTFTEAMEHVARAFEVIGAAVLLAGLFLSIGLSIRVLRRSGNGHEAYKVLRQSFGGVILLGLEVLVAADLVRTVAVEPTLDNVVILGLIVLIRTALSFSLEIEIEGVAPWRRASMSGTGQVARAIERAGGSADAARPRHDPANSAGSAHTA
jgi:uncharacterized membrane protein